MVQAEGLSVNGEMVYRFEDKTFKVVDKPEYKEFTQDDGKTVRKLYLKVMLSDGGVLDYYPNRTSITTMVAKHGIEMDNWIDKPFEWKVLTQMVGKDERKVLYVKP